MYSSFFEEIKKRAAEIKGFSGDLRIVSHYDGDGISAAAVMAKALKHFDKEFHITITKSLDRSLIEQLIEESYYMYIFFDMGSSHIKDLRDLPGQIYVFDHHVPPEDTTGVHYTNPHIHGIDGTDMCSASTIALLLAEYMGLEDAKNFGVAFAGIISDRQHNHGIRGVNIEIFNKWEKRGAVGVKKWVNLRGNVVKEALRESVEPYFKGLTGREHEVSSFLKNLGIKESTRLWEMAAEQERLLKSLLTLRLLKQGTPPELALHVVSDVYFLNPWNMNVRDLSAALNATGRLGRPDIGIAMALGDKKAKTEAFNMDAEYRSRLRRAMMELEKEGLIQKKAIQYFYSKGDAEAGALAGLCMNYLYPGEKATLALAKVEDVVKVSSRGTIGLMRKGLNLAEAMKLAADKVGGTGGGHPIAAGATVPIGKEMVFLDEVDKVVRAQIH